MQFKFWCTVIIAVFFLDGTALAQSQPVSKKKIAQTKTVTKGQATKAQSSMGVSALAPSSRPSILSAPIRKPATLDPNSAVEVRGQARTLSMMLVLKNGKDSINFIKVRKDYRPEIIGTGY